MGNILDRIVSWISPEEGYKREIYRQALERNYDAASYGRPNTNWRAVNESAEITDRMSRDTVRARARDLERNSDVANIAALKNKIDNKGKEDSSTEEKKRS